MRDFTVVQLGVGINWCWCQLNIPGVFECSLCESLSIFLLVFHFIVLLFLFSSTLWQERSLTSWVSPSTKCLSSSLAAETKGFFLASRWYLNQCVFWRTGKPEVLTFEVSARVLWSPWAVELDEMGWFGYFNFLWLLIWFRKYLMHSCGSGYTHTHTHTHTHTT